MCPRLPVARFRLRTWIRRCVLLVIAVIMMRTWYLEGLLVPCRVTSGSMAETLLGPHRNVVCGDCGYRFACGTDLQPVGPRAVCPHCGRTDNDLEALPDLSGDRLVIHKSVFHLRRPERWEVVAFRRRQAEGIHIKRVVGLPGERVRIVQGDVCVDDQVQRKQLPQQRVMAILVHDAGFRSGAGSGPTPRWQGKDPGSRWGAAEGRFACPEGPKGGSIDWLEYRHLRPTATGMREGPITDLGGYNQTRPRRVEDTNVVTDLLLCFRWTKRSGQGSLVVRAGDGREEFRVEIDPGAGRWEVRQSGRPAAVASGRMPQWTDELTIEVSLFDQQFLLALDGQAVAKWSYERKPPEDPTSRPLAIGTQGLGVTIEGVRVYRDVYYTHPIGPDGRWGLSEACRLSDDEYFVLGDNSPISLDSRTWPEGPGVASKLLTGKPLVVHFPARMVTLGRWRFQVPDPAKIRYIR